MGISKTLVAMGSITTVLALMLIFMMGSTLAQVEVEYSCSDKCESSTLYMKGVWNEKLMSCSYNYQETCEYGCESNIPVCKDFPDDPPVDVENYDETLWKMQKQVYDNVKVDLFTGATEYTLGDTATIFAKVTDLGLPVNDGFCDVLIFAPNQTQIAGFNLSYVSNSRGLYSGLYSVPDVYGVYMVDVECFMPFDVSNESRFFRTVSSVDKLLNTTDPSTSYSETVSELGLDIKCMEKRWTESVLDKQNGNISDYRFLQSITDPMGWFSDSSGAAINYEIYYKYYKVTDKGTIYMGISEGSVTIGTGTVSATLSDAGIEMPFDSTSFLQIELCFRRVSGANPTDITFWYNSDSYNSSVDINTLDYDDPLDFVVGGSSEVHVSDIPYETYLTFATLPEPILTSNHDFCIDNSTMGKILTWEQCVSGRCDNVSRNETITCSYGCYQDRCNPEPIDKFLMMMFFLLAVVAIIVAIALIYNKYG